MTMQTSPHLNLLVIRCRDIEAAVLFYRALGLQFVKHRHNNGPEHYSSSDNDFVFEIYPLTDEANVTTGLRFGFVVEDVDQSLPKLAQVRAQIIKAPHDSEWGRRAVIKDLDGHVIELTQYEYA